MCCRGANDTGRSQQYLRRHRRRQRRLTLEPTVHSRLSNLYDLRSHTIASIWRDSNFSNPSLALYADRPCIRVRRDDQGLRNRNIFIDLPFMHVRRSQKALRAIDMIATAITAAK